MTWLTVLVASVSTYVLKLIGMVVPQRVLEHEVVKRVARLMPVALLGALVVLQTFTAGERFVVDARAVGLGVAVVAVVCRAPFLVVVLCACVSTALVRWFF